MKFVAIDTICTHHKFTPAPFKEESLWDGYPEETNAPYGLAKKMMLVQAQAYRQQYGLNAIYLLPVNLSDPQDNFSPENSHVIPGLIKKCLVATDKGEKEIVVWGDGSPTSEFPHVEDAAEAIVLATDRYDKSDPVNIGSGFEISIKNLVNKIVEMTEYAGEVVWDTTNPNGQPRRYLDTTRAVREFGLKAKVDLHEILSRTVDLES